MPLVDIEWRSYQPLRGLVYHSIVISGDSVNGMLTLWVDGEIVAASSSWPPKNADPEERIVNIWLGARPCSPFPEPQRKSIAQDLKGLITNVTVWEVTIDPVMLFKFAQGSQNFLIFKELPSR